MKTTADKQTLTAMTQKYIEGCRQTKLALIDVMHILQRHARASIRLSPSTCNQPLHAP